MIKMVLYVCSITSAIIVNILQQKIFRLIIFHHKQNRQSFPISRSAQSILVSWKSQIPSCVKCIYLKIRVRMKCT